MFGQKTAKQGERISVYSSIGSRDVREKQSDCSMKETAPLVAVRGGLWSMPLKTSWTR